MNRFKKGKMAENIVERACIELQGEGKIIRYERKENSPGVDFLLFFPDKKDPFEIEVKSSYRGVVFHNIRYETKVVVIPIKKKKFSRKKIAVPERSVKKLIRRAKNMIIEIRK